MNVEGQKARGQQTGVRGQFDIFPSRYRVQHINPFQRSTMTDEWRPQRQARRKLMESYHPEAHSEGGGWEWVGMMGITDLL